MYILLTMDSDLLAQPILHPPLRMAARKLSFRACGTARLAVCNAVHGRVVHGRVVHGRVVHGRAVRPQKPSLAVMLLATAINTSLATAMSFANAEDRAPVVSTTQPDIQAYRDHLANLETSQGAYGADLAESLLGLGIALQNNGQHAQAVTTLRRGTHLARVNHGLYSVEQIPLLRAEINSHLAQQHFVEADQRFEYLYRVQTKNADPDALLAVYLEHAEWQMQAYHLRLEGDHPGRLILLSDLYDAALVKTVDRWGANAEQLREPLLGQLRNQYLIRLNRWNPAAGNSQPTAGIDLLAHRFALLRSNQYARGVQLISALYRTTPEDTPEHARARAEALIMLGDWLLWHGKRNIAWQAYRDALAELAPNSAAQQEIAALLAQPTALPALSGVRVLPEPVTANTVADPGQILLEFDVDNRGRVRNLKRVDDNEQITTRANRLMRQLHKTIFRPRFQAGEPIDTNTLVQAYNLQ